MKQFYPSFVAVLMAFTHVNAEPVQLSDYLTSMDRTEVRFSGRIKYNSSESEFTFYDENREPFGVTVDAGGDTLEQVENECNNPSFIVSYGDLCAVSGVGTVEVRGSSVFISLENVDQLIK